jgi:hypothetical protein
MIFSFIREELKKLKIEKRTLRNFGLLFAGIFCMISVYSLWRGNPYWLWFFSASVLFLIPGLFSPGLLRVSYMGWMALSIVLGWVMTRVILTFIYFVFITPYSRLIALLKKDLLDEKIDRQTGTYWKKYEQSADKEQYKKQF